LGTSVLSPDFNGASYVFEIVISDDEGENPPVLARFCRQDT
jgi:hypothetical protein